MARRLHKSGWDHRKTENLNNSRIRFRYEVSRSSTVRGRDTSAHQFLQGSSTIDDDLSRICGAIFGIVVLGHGQTLDSQTLPLNPQSAFVTCFWRSPFVRY